MSTLELVINRKQFELHLETFLRAAGLIRDDQDLMSIDYKGLGMKAPNKTSIPLTLGIRREERTVLTVF